MRPNNSEQPVLLERKAGKHNQQGAVLIVCLVILTILTTIAIGSISDTSLQANMARNRQISLEAFNVALSELRGQFIASTKDENVPSLGITYLQTLSNIREEGNTQPLAAGDLKMDGKHPFDQTFDLEFKGVGSCIGGNGVENSALIYEFNSTTNMDNTGIRSDQSFGICYPNPGNTAD